MGGLKLLAGAGILFNLLTRIYQSQKITLTLELPKCPIAHRIFNTGPIEHMF